MYFRMDIGKSFVKKNNTIKDDFYRIKKGKV